jgi:hypothetical protein
MGGCLVNKTTKHKGYVAKVNEILRDVKRLADETKKITIFSIGNTQKIDKGGLFFPPIRETKEVVAGNVILYNVAQARHIAQLVDGKVDYIFVDAEKKVVRSQYGKRDVGNIERAVKEVVAYSKVVTFKPNDLTVDSIDSLLAQLVPKIGGKKIAILGAGNIGSKLALKLVERGAWVYITRLKYEDTKLISKALNLIKPKQTLATITPCKSNLKAVDDAQIVFGCTTGVQVITKKMVERMADEAIIVDVGKGTITSEALEAAERRGFLLIRLCPLPGFSGVVSNVLATERMLRDSFGRRRIGDFIVVSGGILGRRGDIVVDNVNNPKKIFGMADGHGDFIRPLDSKNRSKIRYLESLLKSNPGKCC